MSCHHVEMPSEPPPEIGDHIWHFWNYKPVRLVIVNCFDEGEEFEKKQETFLPGQSQIVDPINDLRLFAMGPSFPMYDLVRRYLEHELDSDPNYENPILRVQKLAVWQDRSHDQHQWTTQPYDFGIMKDGRILFKPCDHAQIAAEGSQSSSKGKGKIQTDSEDEDSTLIGSMDELALSDCSISGGITLADLKGKGYLLPDSEDEDTTSDGSKGKGKMPADTQRVKKYPVCPKCKEYLPPAAWGHGNLPAAAWSSDGKINPAGLAVVWIRKAQFSDSN